MAERPDLSKSAFVTLSVGWAIVWSACGSKKEAGSAPNPSPVSAREHTPQPAGSDPLAVVNKSLASGDFDQAAARLLEIRSSGKELSQKEAADYRVALEEAYSKALEAAQKGDPRAQATLQMIKAATAR